MNFKAKEIAALPFTECKARVKYKDDGGPQSERALYLYVGMRSKAFYFVRKINGKTIQYKIGEYPATTVDQARKRCRDISSSADQGVNPIEAKRASRQRGISFGDAFEQYITDAKARAEKPLKASTEASYRRLMTKHFDHWLNKEAESITYDMVKNWYNSAAKESPTSANAAYRIARAVYNHQKAISERNDADMFQRNPFKGQEIKKEQARQDCIEAEELPQWFEAVANLTSATTRDYLIVLLFTGLRRREADSLTWADIDLRMQTLTAKDTKNRSDHTIPLSTYLVDLLTQRKKQAENQTNGYVFASTGKSGHLSEPKKAVASIAAQTGIHASPHALRRSYSNFAAFGAEIHELARKRLLNHSIGRDVTAKHYSVLRMPRLKRYQQDVTDWILEAGNQDKPTA